MNTRALLDSVDADRLRAGLFYLAKDPLPRRTVNAALPGHEHCTLDEADSWIEAQLMAAGLCVTKEACPVRAFACDTNKPLHHWYADPLPDSPVYMAHNLSAEVRGDTRPDEVILALAHKDSQSWIECPGALDNGVGTVTILEIARILARRGGRRTVRFLFCNEEHTPWTSVTAARDARARADNLVAVFNVDSVSGKSDEDIAAGRKTNVTLYTEPEGKKLADLMADVNARYRIGLAQTSYRRTVPGDDDGSFVRTGYGCAVANIGSYPYADSQYHLPGDVPERVDIENVRMATQATLAAFLQLDDA